MKRFNYLGHTFNEMGMSPEMSKVECTKNCESERIQTVCGFSNYYRRYIKNFASIAQPLNSLSAKDIPFVWDDHADLAFKKLKELLTSQPILSCQNSVKKFTLCTNASGTGFGQY